VAGDLREAELLSTHADRQGVDISFTVCVCVCTVTDFSTEDKANGVKFCSAVISPITFLKRDKSSTTNFAQYDMMPYNTEIVS